MMRVYKFRSLSNMERALDILINKRFYASEYSKLNDPMEGVFRSDDHMDTEFLHGLETDLKSTKICSFSKVYDNPVLWAHYADNFEGICLEVELDQSACPFVHEVKYDDRILRLSQNDESFQGIFHHIILRRKFEAWIYEQEVRVLTDNAYIGQPCAAITSVLLGLHTPDTVQQCILRLVTQDVAVWTTCLDDDGKIKKAELVFPNESVVTALR